jgi:histone-lysine N-methyltransferase SETMAR
VGDTFHHPTTTESNKVFACGLTEVNITNVADLVKNDRRFASVLIAESLNIPKTVVLPIVREDLKMRKLYARFVPHSLTPARREDPFTSCQDIITVADADKNFFNNIITGDETRCFAYDLETK